MSALTEVASLIRAGGGTNFWPAIYDYRSGVTNVSGAASAWDDVRGAAGFGPQLTQGSAGSRPAIGTGLAFVSASSQHLVSAQATNLTLDQTGPMHILVIAKITGAGYVCALCADPTSAVTYPYATVKGGTTTWQAESRPTSSANSLYTLDAGTLWNDSVIRAVIAGKRNDNPTGGSSTNRSYEMHLGGRQGRDMYGFAVATTVSGGLKLSVGRFGSTYVDATVYWMGVYSGDLTREVLEAFYTFAETSHGAVRDTSMRGTLFCDMDSYGSGTGTTTPHARVAGQNGATTCPFGIASGSGGRGTITAQGFESVQDAFNGGVGGRQIDDLIGIFRTRTQLLPDANRTGPNVLLTSLMGSNSIVNTYTASGGDLLAQQRIKDYCLIAKRGGFTVVLTTLGDRVDFYTTGTLNQLGTNALALNVLLRANWSTYPGCVGLYDFEADSNNYFRINTVVRGFGATLCHLVQGVASASFPTAVYQTDGRHLTDAGFLYMGAQYKAYLDANDTILWPVATRSRLWRR